MRKRKIIQVLIGLLLVAALVLTPMACKAPEAPPVAPPVAPPEEVAPPEVAPPEVAPPVEAPPEVAPPVEVRGLAGLEDIPYIENRTPIHVAICSFGIDWLKPALDRFAEATGIPITTEILSYTILYTKMNIELVMETGAYDVFPVESTCTCEWAPYLWDLYEMADKFDPGGAASLRADMDQVYPALVRQASDRARKLRGMPFYTYMEEVFLRQDVYDDPIEQANFKERYGYELAPPITFDEVYDHGEFFTRKEGELLKGEPLEWDLYGLGMYGMYDINDATSGEIWARGGRWATIVRDAEGNAVEYVITKKDKAILKEALEYQKKLLDNFCSPGCKTGSFDYITPEFIKGRTILLPHYFGSLEAWSYDVEKEIPGAKLGLHPQVGGHAYSGNWYNAVARASGNPEACYWLLRYWGSEEVVRDMVELCVPGPRMDIYRDPKYEAPEWWQAVGQRAAVQDHIFATTETAEQMDSYFQFNSSAMGKIYEMTILRCHEAVVGTTPIDEAVATIVKELIDLQTRFGDLPIREEF